MRNRLLLAMASRIAMEATLSFYQIVGLRQYVYLVTVIPLVHLFAIQHYHSTFTNISIINIQTENTQSPPENILDKIQHIMFMPNGIPHHHAYNFAQICRSHNHQKYTVSESIPDNNVHIRMMNALPYYSHNCVPNVLSHYSHNCELSCNHQHHILK